MGVVRTEDIMGYIFDQEYVCCDCVSKEEKEEVLQNQIITRDDVENSDKRYFCDRCEEKIS